MRFRRFAAAGFAVALFAAAAAVVSAPVGAVTEYNPSAATPDGDTDSLRDVLQNQVVNDDIVNLEAGATYVLDDCEEGDIEVDAAVTIEGNGATIQQTCNDRVLFTEDDLTIRNATLTGGNSFGEGGAIESEGGNVTLEGVVISGNAAFNDGGAIDISEGDLTLVDSLLAGNRTAGDGGAIDTSEDNQTVTVVRSTLANNCAEDAGGALSTQSEDTITFVNSTVTGNTSADTGAIDVDSSGETVTLVYTDVVRNTLDEEADCGAFTDSVDAGDEAADTPDAGPAATSPDGANIDLASESEGTVLRVFGTVIAEPIGALNCGTDGNTTVESSGYNYADDDSCLLDDATDVEVGASPQLGTLGGNGGPTPTLLPALTSPLVDAIPTAACSGGDALAESTITTDQRLLQRPDIVNQKCDIGSVELQTAPIEIEPTFTG